MIPERKDYSQIHPERYATKNLGDEARTIPLKTPPKKKGKKIREGATVK